MILTDAEIERYARQVIMPEIGERGQKKLLNAHVLILGAGGLGAPVIASLAGAGVGHLTILDDDVVELTNLNRQIIHNMTQLSKPKAESAAHFAAQLNPDIVTQIHNERLTPDNADKLIAGHDLVIDCTDNSQTRYLVNDVCQRHLIPLIFGGAVRTDGQITSFVPGRKDSPCLRCIFPETDLDYDQTPSCATAGVIAPTTMIIGALQAAEAIRLLAEFGQTLVGRLLLYDGLSARFTEIGVQPQPDCAICGKANMP